MRRALALGIAVVAALASPASGQPVPPPAEGRVNAIACGTLSAPVTLDIVLLDNAETHLRVKDAFVEALRRRKVEIVPGAALVLTLGIETVREAASVKPPDMIDVQVGQDNRDAARVSPGDTSPGEQGFATVRANIWSNRRDSVLGGRKVVVEGRTVDQVKLSASLNQRIDGRCLWQGDALQELGGADPAEAAVALAPILARALGKSIADQPLEKIR